MASRKRYPREFKLEAARLVVERGYSAKEAAEKVGCNPWSLRDWVGKFRSEGVFPPAHEPVPEADELRRLRQEVDNLRIENEILKKAAAYFAKESL